MAQQTAVEWLVKKFEECELMYGTIQSLIHKQYLDGIIKQAKQMEKEQMKESWFDSTLQFDNAASMVHKKEFEEYYNETFGNK